ncbi:hypothetical protein Bbelb_018310 [Branchiostoma belcheri]|nr:hypothetical protein Bbelb_018310 [Branchiostoma belcheri]
MLRVLRKKSALPGGWSSFAKVALFDAPASTMLPDGRPHTCRCIGAAGPEELTTWNATDSSSLHSQFSRSCSTTQWDVSHPHDLSFSHSCDNAAAFSCQTAVSSLNFF